MAKNENLLSERLDSFSNAYGSEFPYSLDNDLILNWYPNRIMNMVTGKSLLELGVGHGFSTVRFSKYFSRHVVIDGSPEIIENFKKEFPDCSAELVNDFFETFDTNDQFDTIVMGFILEHVENPKLILDRYRKYLKPGGSIFVTVPNAEALNKRIGYEAGLIDDLFDLGAGDIELGHKRVFSVSTLKELALELDYTPIHIEGIFLKPITTGQIQQLNLSREILNSMLAIGVNYPELCVGILMQLKNSNHEFLHSKS